MPTSRIIRWNDSTHIYEFSTDFGGSWSPLALDGSILNQGTVAPARLGSGSSIGTKFLRGDSSWQTISAPTTFDASAIVSGLLALARGGTGVDLSAAGGATKLLAQDAAHVISARNLVDADLTSNVPLKNGTNAFTGANSFATNPLDLLVGQVKFPASQNASSDVNTLDDYEEGTWTPAITGSTSTTGQSYSKQKGTYIKIGRSVTIQFEVILTAKGTITGNVMLSGLPFTIAPSSPNESYAGIVITEWNMSSAWSWIGGETNANTTRFFVTGSQGAVSTTQFPAASDIGNATYLIGSATFEASA